MIQGNCNNTYKYVAPYVLTKKNHHYDYREYPGYLAGDGPAVMSVGIVHSDIYNGRWIYFAWVELQDLNGCPREILMKFDQDELFNTPADAWTAQEKHSQAVRMTCYKYARCYHHHKKQGLLQKIKNLLANRTSRTVLKSLPARPESTQGRGSSLPALPTLRRML